MNLIGDIKISEQESDTRKHILVITGYSGAGKKTMLYALEDGGFFCVDNLPPSLLDAFFHFSMQSDASMNRIAVGLDVRGSAHMNDYVRIFDAMPAILKERMRIIFLQSRVETLIKRFQETRRRHPLAHQIALEDAIEQERTLLLPLRERAHMIIDTDTMTIHDVRRLVYDALATDMKKKMVVTVTSFGFKYGVPLESSMVCDLRFLPNPYFVADLKRFDGTQQVISDYLFAHQTVCEYWQHFNGFVRYSIEQAHKEGRSFMNIAIGCTGGRHRSVAFVHRFVQEMMPHITFITKHRDLHRDEYEKKEL